MLTHTLTQFDRRWEVNIDNYDIQTGLFKATVIENIDVRVMKQIDLNKLKQDCST